MRKYWLRILLFTGCLLVLPACDQSSSGGSHDADQGTAVDQNAPMVRSKVSASGLRPGDDLAIEVEIDNFPAIEGGGITLRFDPGIIRVNGVDFDPAWNFVNQSGTIDNAAGEVRNILFSSFGSPSGALKIATLQATVIGTGTTSIVIEESQKNPFAGGGNKVTVVFAANEIEIK